MYPFDFKPKMSYIDFNKIFVVMPFADEFKPVYANLIESSIKHLNKNRSTENELYCIRADDPLYTRSGWIEILEHIHTSRIIIGLLSGDNANIFYELGIAHATQQIERQLLLAEKYYKPKFDLKDLIYIEYDNDNLEGSISDLSNAIIDTLKVHDINRDKQVSFALSEIGMYEFEVVRKFGHVSHFYLRENVEPRFYDGLSFLCHSRLLRLSTKSIMKENQLTLEYSYYWTNLGNAVLNRLKIINEDEMKNRYSDYNKFFDV